MKSPKITALYPAEVFLEVDREYNWCACGRSQKEPFCDGSHQNTGIKPVQFKVVKSKTVFFCLCKHTKNPPICDGSHSKLVLEIAEK